MPARAGVQSVGRSFNLLETLASSEVALGVSELSAACGLPFGTTHRLLRSLADLGYVRQEPSRSYALGARLVRLGARAANSLAVWSRPLLEEAAHALGESVNLATLEADRVLYLGHVPGSGSMRVFTEVGNRVAAHSTGVGKAMLAQLPPAEARALLLRTGLDAATEHTITDPDRLLGALHVIARQGYALDEEEQELGVRCVAVAARGADPPLAVSTSGPTVRMTAELLERAVPLLQRIAVAIEDQTASVAGGSSPRRRA